MSLVINLQDPNIARAIDMAKLSFVSSAAFWAIGTKLYTAEYQIPDWKITLAFALPVFIVARRVIRRLQDEFDQTYSGQIAGLCIGTITGFLVSKLTSFAVSYFLKKPSFY